MPVVQVRCPACSASYSVDSQLNGRKARCKHCGQTFSLNGSGDSNPSTGSGPASSPFSVLPAPSLVSSGGEAASVSPAPPKMVPPGPDLPEQFGRYRIMRTLGRGGMGAVYLAHDTQLDRPVALKVPHFTPTEGPEAIERFYREARAAAFLDHPNLCPVFDVGQIDGIHYLTMPYIEGKPLSATINPDKPTPMRQAAAVIRKLALALQEAHAKGIIHRDLKPANIMANRRRELVIMDFGLARRLDLGDSRLTKSGALLGTPLYMAPEQVRGDHDAIGPASDIYSLGVILYELLAGRRPFDGPVSLVLALILVTEPPRLSEYRPDIDPALEAICQKAMAKRIEDRFATMEEFAEALSEFLDSGSAGVSVPSVESTPVEEPIPQDDDRPVIKIERSAEISLRSRKPPPRNRRHLIVAGAAALAAVLLGVIIWIQTDNGTIQIALSDPNAMVKITVDGDEVTLQTSDKKVRVKAGRDHKLVVRGKDFETVAESFTLSRGEEKVLTVTLKPVVVLAVSKQAKPEDKQAKPVAVKPEPKEAPTPPEDDPAAMPADDPVPTPAEKATAPTRLVEYYSQGAAGTWTLLRDSRGQTIAGIGSDLSSDGLELVVRRTSPEGLFIARRASIEKPFDEAERLPLVGSEGTFFGSPSFARGDRELRYLNWGQGQDDAPKPVMSSTRAERRNDFLKASPIHGLGPAVEGGTRWSANDTYTLVYPKIDEPPWLVRRKGRSFDAGKTNLPARKIESHSRIAPVTVRGDGSVLYTQDIDGGIWLYGVRRRPGTTFYDTPARLLDLKHPPGRPHVLSLSRDVRMIIDGHDDHLMHVMRVPEGSRREIISLLGPPFGGE
jgi:predicted Zn finger-like uncharacterized protein